MTDFPDAIFEIVVRPSTWDGPEQDRRLGLYYDFLHAQEVGREWIARNPYPFQGGGRWQLVITEQPTDTTAHLARTWGDQKAPEVENILVRNGLGELVSR